jgi:hypothetical protein
MATLQRRNQGGQTRTKGGHHECSDLVPRLRGARGLLKRLSKVTDLSPADPPAVLKRMAHRASLIRSRNARPEIVGPQWSTDYRCD